MKIRRRFASGGVVGRAWAAFRAWRGTSDTTGTTEATGPTGTTGPTLPSFPAFPPLEWPARIDRRFALIAAGVFLAALLAGYLVAALVFFPAPIFATSRSVPRVIGLSEDAAREQLAAQGLRVGAVQRASHPSAAAGIVVWQDPPPGMVAPEATEVALDVSTGPQRIPVPDVAGYEADHARMLIEAAGLRVGSTESTQAPTPKNVVVNTRPPTGSALSPGSAVTLVVSVGAATIRIPSLIGLTLAEARLALETAGLRLGTWYAETSSAVAPGEISSQDPAPGTLSAPGAAVNVRTARSRQ